MSRLLEPLRIGQLELVNRIVIAPMCQYSAHEDTLALAAALQRRGCAALHVTSGGISPEQNIRVAPGYQVPYSRRVKAKVGLPTIAVGLITAPELAEAIIANREADAVSLARGALRPALAMARGRQARRTGMGAPAVLALQACRP